MYVTDDPKEFYDLTPSEQEQLCAWIKLNFLPTKSFEYSEDSYSLHGLFERTPGGFYISHGAFKQAMLLCGFRADNESLTTWHFNISKKSPALLIRLK